MIVVPAHESVDAMWVWHDACERAGTAYPVAVTFGRNIRVLGERSRSLTNRAFSCVPPRPSVNYCSATSSRPLRNSLKILSRAW